MNRGLLFFKGHFDYLKGWRGTWPQVNPQKCVINPRARRVVDRVLISRALSL
jgi:hypothetical protein